MNSEQLMGASTLPLVSIITPAYNEAEYLGECIESVLRQTYKNWTYTIVDNCSTDETFAIARRYADRDPRITVLRNSSLLPIIKNHNEAIRHTSPESKYCKIVFADDWLYPTCLEEMVSVAEQNPSIGLVGSYTTDGQSVLWTGPSSQSPRIGGRDVCREKLLGGPYLFGTMTCVLVRSDLVRKRRAFFNERNLHADQEACFDVLLESDFGFVYQVLSFSRARAQSYGSFAEEFCSIDLGDFVVLLKYGPLLLQPDEYKQRLRIVRRNYYRLLAHNVLRLRPREFQKYHQDTLTAFGSRIYSSRLTTAIVAEVARLLFRPVQSFRHAWSWWSAAVNRRLKRPASV